MHTNKCNEKIYSLPSSLQKLCSHESNLSQAFPRLTGEHGLQLKTEYWRQKGSASMGDSDQHFQDHSNHGRSNEPMNPCPEWIHRFI